MSTFLWVMIVVMSLENIARLVSLATGKIPTRTPGPLAVDIVINTGLIVWAAVLLFS